MLRALVDSSSRLLWRTSSLEYSSNLHPAVSAFSAPPRYISEIFGHEGLECLPNEA
jgi:hypothetical protein